MAENRDLEDLDALVKSPGWAIFTRMVEQTYGRTSDRFYNAVTAAAKGDNPHATDHLRQIIAEQRGALDAVGLVAQRLKVLTPPTVHELREYVGSRRGSL